MKLKLSLWLRAFIIFSILTCAPAWADLSKTEVSSLYVAIFGRASEGEGNTYWQYQPDMATAAEAMLDTQAARDYFGASLDSNLAFIEHIYLNTLNKSLNDDYKGIHYWVSLLETGISRGEVVAAIVAAIETYGPGGDNYNSNDAAAIVAYNQFVNRVNVSDYMANNVWDTPADWETSTSFSQGLIVTHDPATVITAMGVVISFLDDLPGETGSFPVVDTGQSSCFDDSGLISCPGSGGPFYGQDAQYSGNPPSYTDNGDGTVTDNVTGLMWQQSPDTNGDGEIDAVDKLTYEEAVSGASAQTTGGYTDWRLPTIKELYSLILFSGVDPSGYEGTDTSWLVPFIQDEIFDFAYGDTHAGERIIDAQYASGNLYVGNTAGDGGGTLFGVNFADGRIKGYGLSLLGSDKTFFVLYVRGNTGYGQNSFMDNGDGTITDNATNLMWAQNDSGTGLNWEEALAWVQTQNASNYMRHDDWRLPNAKELQSIVDYSRSPDTTGSAAIDPLFNTTSIVNEAEETDYPFYWTGTTHTNWSEKSGGSGAYVAFGRAMGYMGSWVDVHGAGAQRSDPKTGDPADYPTGNGPQGDAIRIYNYVRLVRTVSGS